MATVGPTEFDRVMWMSAGQQTLPDLAEIQRLASHERRTEQITVETVISEDLNPVRALASRTSFVYTDVREVGLVSVMRVLGDKGYPDHVVSAWPTAHPGVFHLVGSVPVTDPRWRRIGRWMERSRELSPCYLNHDDFLDLGASLAEFGEVEVSRLTARRRSDLSSLTRGWKARAGTLRPSPQSAIAEIEADHAAARTLSVQVADLLSVHLRRLAGATFYSGDFDLFQRLVMGKLAAAAGSRRSLLTDRARRLDGPATRPVVVQLPGPVLADAEATGELLADLERQRETAIAVLHRNPYLHVVITDAADGSNFDLFVTAADRVELHPGFRASLSAMARLTQRIGERFEALEIAEAAEPGRVSLEDLTSSR